MTTYQPKPGSMAEKVVALLTQNAPAKMTGAEIAESSGCARKDMSAQLKSAIENGLIHIDATQWPRVYSLGDGVCNQDGFVTQDSGSQDVVELQEPTKWALWQDGELVISKDGVTENLIVLSLLETAELAVFLNGQGAWLRAKLEQQRDTETN